MHDHSIEQAKAEFLSQWGVEGMPKDKQRLANAAFDAAIAAVQAAVKRNAQPVFWMMDLDDTLTDIAGGVDLKPEHDYGEAYLSCIEVSASLPLFLHPPCLLSEEHHDE